MSADELTLRFAIAQLQAKIHYNLELQITLIKQKQEFEKEIELKKAQLLKEEESRSKDD